MHTGQKVPRAISMTKVTSGHPSQSPFHKQNMTPERGFVNREAETQRRQGSTLQTAGVLAIPFLLWKRPENRAIETSLSESMASLAHVCIPVCTSWPCRHTQAPVQAQ